MTIEELAEELRKQAAAALKLHPEHVSGVELRFTGRQLSGFAIALRES